MYTRISNYVTYSVFLGIDQLIEFLLRVLWVPGYDTY